MNRRLTTLFTLLALCFATAPSAFADVTALAHLQRQQQQIERSSRPRTAVSGTSRVAELVSGLLDYEELARQALGSNWQARTPAERTEFTALLRQLVERSYQQNLAKMQNYEIRYVSESAAGDKTVVHTEARSKTQRRAPATSIDYTMAKRGDSWRVVDITTDGVSMTRNYRSQFGRIIARDGFATLITKMRNRLQNGNGDF